MLQVQSFRYFLRWPSTAADKPRLARRIDRVLTPARFHRHDIRTRERQSAPRFKDPPYIFRHQTVNSVQCIILDVRFLKVRFVKELEGIRRFCICGIA